MKTIAFAKRNAKEILRDPLSYIFCVGFPVVMLIMMTIVNRSIPAEANMDIFDLSKLSPAVAVFGFTFIMLFTATLIAKDRNSQFLDRLCGAPMKSVQFLAGYAVPVLLIAILQALLTYIAAYFVSLLWGGELKVAGCFLSIAVFIPAILMFIGIGVIFGCLFSDKAAPGISSVVITAASILGGIWMDVKMVGGAFFSVAKGLPFYWQVEAGRNAVELNTAGISEQLIIPVIYCVVICIAASFALKKRLCLLK